MLLSGDLMYIFLPIPLIRYLLLKIKKDKVIMIAPAWPCQHWFGMPMDLAVAAPWALPSCPDLLS